MVPPGRSNPHSVTLKGISAFAMQIESAPAHNRSAERSGKCGTGQGELDKVHGDHGKGTAACGKCGHLLYAMTPTASGREC